MYFHSVYNFILYFLICFSAYCLEDIPYTALLKNNVGGLNSKASPVTVDDSEASDLLNINLDTDGAIKKRPGYTVLNSTALIDQVDGLFVYTQAAGTRYMIAAAAKLYKMDALDGTWDDITGTTTITTGYPMRAANYGNSIVMTNGYNKVQDWTGSSVCTDNDCVNDISLTKAKYIESFVNRLFLANVTVSSTDYPNRLYFSDVTQIGVWTSLNYITIGYNDGDVITGIVATGGYLYVFKKQSIYKVTATGDTTVPFTSEKTYATDGCIAPDTIQPINNKIFYLSQNGICVFNGSTSQVLSYKIQPTLQALDQTNLINAKSGVYKRLNQYWISVSDGDTGDRIIVFDYYHNCFLLHNGIHALALTSIIDSADVERFYFGDFLGYVYRYNVGYNDNPGKTETAINAYYITKHYELNSFITDKIMRYLILIFQYTSMSSNLNIYYTYDLQTSDLFHDVVELQNAHSAKWDTAVWDVAIWPGEGATYKRIDLKSAGITIRLKFQNNALDETFTLYGWEFGYKGGQIVKN